jgi:hypothetical protein
MAGDVALIASLVLPLHGQSGSPVHTYEAFVPSPEFTDYKVLIDQGRIDDAVALLEGVAQANRGTTRGAVALMTVAGLYQDGGPEDWPKAMDIYRKVEAQYPNSGFEIGAKENELEITIPFDQHQAWLLKADQLAQSYGGPAIEDVLRGDRQKLAQRVRSLPVEFQQCGLPQLYLSMHDRIIQLKRVDDGIAIARFLQASFLSSELTGDFTHALRDDLVQKKYGRWPGFTNSDGPVENPVITPKSPQPDHTSGPRPKIRLEITAGDFLQPQVDMSKLALTLDGQDLRPGMAVASKIDRSIKQGDIFERLRISVRPSAPLTRGSHTVSVMAQVNGYDHGGPGVSRITWSFIVASDKDNDDDDKPDDDDDD